MDELQKHSDVYPYLVIRQMNTVYSVRHPQDPNISRDGMLEWGRSILQAKGKRVCAVFSAHECAYMELDGSINYSETSPSGGLICS